MINIPPLVQLFTRPCSVAVWIALLLPACYICVSAVFEPTRVSAETYRKHQSRRPDLFHPITGLRIARHRSPTPDDIPLPARRIGAERVASLMSNGAIAIDVFAALQSRYDDLDGTWLVSKPRLSLPGAFWLPETGRGVLSPQLSNYLKLSLERLTSGQKDQPVIVFCVADCWMSWNAAQRIAELGYKSVYWFALGTDGWQDSGRELRPVKPIPVPTD